MSDNKQEFGDLIKYFQELKVDAKKATDKQLKVGWFESAKYSDGKSVAKIVNIQEYGAINDKSKIPPRPFFRNAIKENEKDWVEIILMSLRSHFEKRRDFSASLDLLGGVIEDDLKRSIDKILTPPLSPYTVLLRRISHEMRSKGVSFNKARQSVSKDKDILAGNPAATKPLIDTGYMKSTVTHVVVTKKDKQ